MTSSAIRVVTFVGSREEIFRQLAEHELPNAYATASLILRDEVEAEDAVQEAMLRAWERLGQLRDPKNAGAWFGRILLNVCRGRLRRQGRTRISWIKPETETSTRDLGEHDQLLRAMSSLNADQQIAVVLRFYLDLSLEAIADRTGAPLGTVKTRLRSGLQSLRAAYDAEERAGR